MMTVTIIISAGFVCGVLVVAFWASRLPSDRSPLLRHLTRGSEDQCTRERQRSEEKPAAQDRSIGKTISHTECSSHMLKER